MDSPTINHQGYEKRNFIKIDPTTLLVSICPTLGKPLITVHYNGSLRNETHFRHDIQYDVQSDI